MQSTALQSPGHFRPQLFGLIVLLGTLVAFHNSLNGSFLLDDYEAIHANPTIHQIWPLRVALQPPRETAVAGRPLVNLSLAVNYAIHGTEPRGYHIVNLAIHAVAALALFGLLQLLFRSPVLNGRFGQHAGLIATVVATLWAVHPLQTESVTYIVQRAESLCGLMYLLTLCAFARSVSAPRPHIWWAVSVVACTAGMACKETMVTAPVMVLLIDRALYASSFRKALSSRRILYAGLAASWITLVLLLMGSPRPVSAGLALPFGPMAYLRTEAGVVLHYLRLAFWPNPLILDYGWPISPSWSQALPACAIVIALLATSAFVWIRRPALGLPAVAFFLLLAPTSSVYPILDAAFEHRMYLPLAPVIVMVVLGLWILISRGTSRNRARAPFALVGCVLIPLHSLTLYTMRRNSEYADPVALWRSNLEHGGFENPRAWTNLSSAFLMKGQAAEARDAALYAIQKSTDNVEAFVNLCAAANQLGLVEESINAGRTAVQLKPRSVEARVNLGMAYKSANRLDDARYEFMQALVIQEQCVPALDGLHQIESLKRGTTPPLASPSTAPAGHKPRLR